MCLNHKTHSFEVDITYLVPRVSVSSLLLFVIEINASLDPQNHVLISPSVSHEINNILVP